jgi:hypothetical protein
MAPFVLLLILAVSASAPERAGAQTVARPSAENTIAAPIGKIVSAKGVVAVEHVNAVILQAKAVAGNEAKTGDLVYKGDVVSTGADGALGIVFADGSAFNLSSNARMALDEFVYDPKGNANSTFFTLTKGTFTFIAGKVAKTGDMKIDTPLATMGVRGTTPHVSISEDGTVAFSTLVEDKKAIEKVIAEGAAPPPAKQRYAKIAQPPAGVGSAPPAQKKMTDMPATWIDATYRLNLNVCRGC